MMYWKGLLDCKKLIKNIILGFICLTTLVAIHTVNERLNKVVNKEEYRIVLIEGFEDVEEIIDKYKKHIEKASKEDLYKYKLTFKSTKQADNFVKKEFNHLVSCQMENVNTSQLELVILLDILILVFYFVLFVLFMLFNLHYLYIVRKNIHLYILLGYKRSYVMFSILYLLFFMYFLLLLFLLLLFRSFSIIFLIESLIIILLSLVFAIQLFWRKDKWT